jgi:hypothetical protein
MNWYRQVRLERGNTHTVCWIPEENACLGRVLELKRSDGQWEIGWVVRQIWSRCLRDDLERKNKSFGASIDKMRA